MENYHDDPIVQAAFLEAKKHIDGHSHEIIVDSDINKDDLTELKDEIANLEFKINSYQEAMRTSQDALAKLDKSFSDIYKKDLIDKADIYLSYLVTKKLLFDFASKLGLSIWDVKSQIAESKNTFFDEQYEPSLALDFPEYLQQVKVDFEKNLVLKKENEVKKLLDIKTKGLYKNLGFEINSLYYMVEFWENLSSKGNLEATYNLALAYKEKLIDLNNINKAIELFTRCVSNGDGDAAYNLYLIYSDYTSDKYDDNLATSNLNMAKEYGSNLLNNHKDLSQRRNRERLKLNNLKSIGENDIFDYLSSVFLKSNKETKLEKQKYIKESLLRKYSWSSFASSIHNLEFDLIDKNDKILFSKTHSSYLTVMNKTDVDISFLLEFILSDGTLIKKNVTIENSNSINITLMKNMCNDINISSISFLDSEDTLNKRRFKLQFNNA